MANIIDWGTAETADASGHYFTLAELRATADEFDNVTKYPDETLEQKRDEAEEDFEAIAHRAFVPRTATAVVRGGEAYVFLAFRDIRTLVSVTLAGVAVDTTGVVIDPILGGLLHPSVWPAGILTVTYTHGLDAPNAAVKGAVLKLAKIYTKPSAIDPRATAVINTEVGGYRISVAGKDGTTGIPDVDAAAARYGDNTPVVG